MTAPVTGTNSATPTAAGEQAPLQRVARQLEGVFVQQLFKAMRETVPQDGAFSGGAGEEMFTSMLDERMAEQAPAQWDRGLSGAIVRAFRDRVSSTPTVEPTR
ncbi:MAG: rod-binding protein [Gemmatimonadaceae bacterium]|nr:rod-binding protein [Gemmatimonadaceae bacterium]